MSNFSALFAELSTTRSHLETMRASGGHYAERAALQTRLHGLRAEMASARAAMLEA